MKKSLLIIACMLTVLSFRSVQAQNWQRTIGPSGAWIWSILPAQNKLLAATTQGLYKSTDQGNTWQIDTSGIPPQRSIRALVRKGNVILAGTMQGVYRSVDEGQSWTITAYLDIAYGMIANDHVFLLYDYWGFVYSSVDGLSWSDAGVSGNRLGKNGNTLYLASGIRLLRSTDNGVSWQQVYSQQGGYNCIAGDGQVLIASSVQGGYLRSTDDGNSFTPVTSGLPPTGATGLINTSYISFRNDTVYAGLYASPHEIYWSSDRGLNWSKLNTGNQKVSATCFHITNDYILAGSILGMYKSTNRGQSWTYNPNQNINNTTVHDMHINGNDWFLATGASAEYGGSKGLYKTSDGAVTYTTPAPDGFGISSNSKVITGINNVLLMFNVYTLYRSTDYGATWESNLSAGFSPTGFFVDGNRIFAGTYFEGLWKSDDLGLTWTQVLPNTVSVNGFTKQNGQLFIATNGFVRKSTDGGLTWTLSGTGIPGTNTVISIASNDHYIFAAAQSAAYSTIFRSGDNGNTWQPVSSSLPFSLYKAMAVKNDTLVIGTDEPGNDFINTHIYMSPNNGNSWQSFTQGMYVTSDIKFLRFAGNTLLAGTESAGLWKMNLAAGSNGTVPVTLLSFQAMANGENSVSVNWAVENEQSMSAYEVEYSTDGMLYSRAGIIPPNGGPYQFPHRNLLPGMYYYRLKMLSQDGSTRYSEIRTVSIAGRVGLPVSIYPNPASDILCVSGDAIRQITITDMSGRILLKQKALPVNRHTLTVSHLPSGACLLLLDTENGKRLVQKVMITH